MQIQVQEHRVYVHCEGKGPPALFLHGVPDTAELWNPAIAGVADRYCCYAPDFQGIHRSAANPDFDYRFDGYADWVEALVVALGISAPITLVVHDWGGLIGLAWAAKYPQRVAAVVAINTVFTPRYRPHLLAKIWATPLLGELAMRLMRRGLLARELRRGARRLDATQIDAIWLAGPSQHSARKTILKLYRSVDLAALAGWNARWQTLAATIPVKVLWGAHDPYLPRWIAGSFHTHDIEIVKDCGHWLPAEVPERLITALRALPAVGRTRMQPFAPLAAS